MILIEDALGQMTVWYGDRSNPEYGTITSRNNKYVFVLFQGCWQSKACRPEDLNWPPSYCARDEVNVPWQKYETLHEIHPAPLPIGSD